jgi:cation transport protein ChaC
MAHDTQAQNQARNVLGDQEEIWLFGYGSLIFKVDFDYLDCKAARIDNWTRRFWQGSHDHRGTPQAPGRVATLVESPGDSCMGMAYLVDSSVFAHLDHREKNGYLRFTTPLIFDDGSQANGLVYIATEDNAAYLGPATEAAIAEHVHQASGPSGPNDEYVLRLAEALRSLGEHDEHTFAIEAHLQQLASAAKSTYDR